MQDLITESIRYWERRRFVYNAALGLVLVGSFLAQHSLSAIKTLCWIDLAAVALMAFIANLLYCAAYAADLFLQLSEFRDAWKRSRWMLLVVGTLFAAALYFFRD